MRRKTFSWQLPREIEARLGESTYGRQRAICEAEHLLIILHAPPDPETHAREPQVFLRKPDGVVLWNGTGGGELRLRQLLVTYRELLERYDDALDNAQTVSDLFEILEPLGPLNRATTHLSQALQAAREHAREDAFLIAMRDEAYEISRGFEILTADAKLALDYRIAQNAEAQMAKAKEMAAAQHKLNILAAATFPLMAVATFFGMNLVHGFESAPGLFWVVLLAGCAVGGYTVKWVTTR